MLETARPSAYKAVVNFAMMLAYWQIARLIVENEQNSENRAEYGKKVLDGVAERLTADFGQGFDARKLRQMHQFDLLFSKWDVMRPILSWIYYRLLPSVGNEDVRNWYMNESTAENWLSRQLERQISVLYYDRMLLSTVKQSTKLDKKI